MLEGVRPRQGQPPLRGRIDRFRPVYFHAVGRLPSAKVCPHQPRTQRPCASWDSVPARFRAAAPPPRWYTGRGRPADGRTATRPPNRFSAWGRSALTDQARAWLSASNSCSIVAARPVATACIIMQFSGILYASCKFRTDVRCVTEIFLRLQGK